MNKHIVVGLEIGTTKIACLIGIRGSQSDKIRILGAGHSLFNALRHGIIENLEVVADLRPKTRIGMCLRKYLR